MKALIFRYSLPRLAWAKILGALNPKFYLKGFSPLILDEIAEPELPADDWVIVRTALCGICGSDIKQVFLDGDLDNPLTALISFPAVLGHEIVGIVDKKGAAVKDIQIGDRVVVNPWLACEPRGIKPLCSACQRGQQMFCENFTKGILSPSLHLGNCRDANGGFAPLFSAHQSQLFKIPDKVTFEQAVLADPFSVAFHAIIKALPKEGSLALVYGCGTLGLLSIAILNGLFPYVKIAAVAKYKYQADLAEKYGSDFVICARKAEDIISKISQIVGIDPYKPWHGKLWLGKGVDVIYDTVGSPASLEVGLRIINPMGDIVISGVDRPRRFEWTPLYFKEVNIIGSNAFGFEEWQGMSRHAMEIYLDFCSLGKFELSELVTHKFALEDYQKALLTANKKSKYKAVKVVFEFGK